MRLGGLARCRCRPDLQRKSLYVRVITANGSSRPWCCVFLRVAAGGTTQQARGPRLPRLAQVHLVQSYAMPRWRHVQPLNPAAHWARNSGVPLLRRLFDRSATIFSFFLEVLRVTRFRGSESPDNTPFQQLPTNFPSFLHQAAGTECRVSEAPRLLPLTFFFRSAFAQLLILRQPTLERCGP